MQEKTKARRKPNIKISATDHARLSTLANTTAERNAEVADELFAELDRARVTPDSSMSDDIVQMGSTVEFKPDTGESKTVTLVFPGDADISAGKVSILTPIGTALLGLAPGQSIQWTARDGRTHELNVIKVYRSADSEPA
ncbi:nucleoside diphosphate kinase regulator [Pseudaminobacter arsenicus]|uniref:Nucleoside diphosphate kinase regulator n=1 Tax=Borborobacter arsenicus TaxID=1851146 RepID=A0A432VAK3_9HYPH|nr:nucleoside diphosphate kinase regulator [Pseudaminobacter arsenicus]RUM99123.1 nucleoside diphosphate kinase regulator [Pseudaminobacter arsenicus]